MIKDIVEALIHKYGTNCPFTLANLLGINIVYETLGETMGYFTHDFRIKFIHLNQQLNDKDSIYTCSHELGHAILHPNVNTPFLKRYTLFSTAKIERQANTFAVELLLPDKVIEESGENSLFVLANRFGIPQRLAELKTVKKF